MRRLVRSYWTPAGRRALGNLIGMAVCTAVSQACAFLTLLVLTYGLDQPAFGAVIFALNLQVYLVTLGSFGTTTVVVRDLTQRPDQADETTTAFLTIVAAAATATGVLTALAAAVVPVSWDERVMLWCVAAGSLVNSLNLNPIFDAAHRQALSAARLVPGDVLALMVVGGLYLAGVLTVPAVGLVMLGKWCLTAVLQVLLFRRSVGQFRWTPRREHVRRMAVSAFPILLAGLLYMVPIQGGVIAVRLLLGGNGVAVYGLAVQAGTLYVTLTWLLVRVLQPHISGPYGLERGFVMKLMVVCVLVFGGLWLAGVAGGWVLTRYLLPSDYGEGFVPVVLLLTAGLLSAPARVANVYLTRFGREEHIAWLYAAAAAVFVVGVAAARPASPTGFGVLVVAAIAVPAVGAVANAVVFARSAAEPDQPAGGKNK